MFEFVCLADGREVVELVGGENLAEAFGALVVTMDTCWLSWEPVSIQFVEEVSRA